MVWLTWRQHRIEALVAGLLFIFLIVLLIVTGFNINTAARYMDAERFQQQFVLSLINPLVLCWSSLPLLVGVFIGAPLVAREVEQGTHRLIWTQGITRVRWMTGKLSLLMGVIALMFLILTAFLSWWSYPVDATIGPWWMYDIQGTVLVSYALFAFALGTAIGALVCKVVPAMALTIPGFVLFRLAVLALRPYFLPQMSYTWDPRQNDPRAGLGDWDVTSGWIDHQGQRVSSDYLNQLCPPLNPGKDKIRAFQIMVQCWHDHGILNFATYHPTSQFWLSQVIETAIFLALSTALVILSIWWVKHRIN